MSDIILITGANKGLGYESARRLIELGRTVIVTARDLERGRSAAERLGARFVRMDVTDEESIKAAVADVEAHEGRLNVLINNAGVMTNRADTNDGNGLNTMELLTAAEALRVYDMNVFGALRVTMAFLPLLRRSEHPAVINVSSGMGSQGLTHDPERVESQFASPLYGSSKAALTMMTTQLAKALPDIRVNAVDPGYTATDLNGFSGTQTVTEGTDAIVALATEGPDGGTGRFVDRFGTVPW